MDDAQLSSGLNILEMIIYETICGSIDRLNSCPVLSQPTYDKNFVRQGDTHIYFINLVLIDDLLVVNLKIFIAGLTAPLVIPLCKFFIPAQEKSEYEQGGISKHYHRILLLGQYGSIIITFVDLNKRQICIQKQDHHKLCYRVFWCPVLFTCHYIKSLSFPTQNKCSTPNPTTPTPHPLRLTFPAKYNKVSYTFQTCYCFLCDNYQFKLMKKRQAQAKESPSKVLLICVYDTVIIQVTNQIVFARFSPFGPIIKILIFEKGEVTKFFLEFLQLQHAVKAKNFLDGSKLYESICKMNIYYSNFASVDLKHQTTEGVNIEPLVYSPAPPYYYFPQQYYQYPNYYPQDCRDQYAEVALAFQNMSLGKENYAREYFQHQNTGCEVMSGAGEQAIERSIESSIDWLLRSEEKKTAKDEQYEQVRELQVREENCFVRFGLEQDLSNRNVYNLFSNFGNISYIKKTKHNVFIKFRSVEFAAMARNYLHGYKLMGNTLDLANLTDLTQAQPREQEYSEITYFDSSFDRFTPQKSITINPPGNTIHVSSLRRQSCRQDNLKYLFQEFGPVQAVQILGNHQKNMALVKFHNIEDSFAAVAEMHNRQIQGRKIQISFTKSKLY